MAVSDRDAALDALADELVAVSGVCDEHAAAREQAEEQVGMVGGWTTRPIVRLLYCTRSLLLLSALCTPVVSLVTEKPCCCPAHKDVSAGCPAMHALRPPLLTLAAAATAAVFAQVVSLATELEDALLQLCTREELLEQIWAQLRGVAQPPPSAAAAAVADAPGTKAAVASALTRTEELQRLRQQQKQRWNLQPHGTAAGAVSAGSRQGSSMQGAGLSIQQQQQQQGKSVAGLVRRLSSSSDANAPSAGIMQQAVQAAMRRSSQHSDGEKGGVSGGGVGGAAANKGYRLQQHQQQQRQQQGQKAAQQQQREQDQMQAVVVDAVRQLREQVAS